jgi:predicted DNA-binding antitoxin AbrB/MazE fold protein
MVIQGVVHNGVIVTNEPLTLPEGTQVTIELKGSEPNQVDETKSPRQGGWLKGQIVIAPDFDELPDDMREAFGMNET